MLGAWVSFWAAPGPLAGMNLRAMSELLARIAEAATSLASAMRAKSSDMARIAEASDVAAFHELYQSYGPRVKAYLVRRGADPATAEDLAQETLLAVWRRAALFSSAKGTASTWIFSI